jgi:hypothetical protein
MAMKDVKPGFAGAALATAQLLYQEATAMQPQANITFMALLPEGRQRPIDEAGALPGVEDFGSSSVLDDMAYAATWLGKATGAAS